VTAVLVVLAVVALAAIVIGVLAVQRRRPPRRGEDGVASFQRHLDALSPEARRQVIDRVKKGDR
jgi:hypothetical protein